MTRNLDRVAAEQARDEAIDRAEGGASAIWRVAAWEAVREVARTHREFTTDEVIVACKVAAREPRAWGAIMRDAVKRRLCEPLDRYRPSRLASCHARPKRQYASLVYEGA